MPDEQMTRMEELEDAVNTAINLMREAADESNADSDDMFENDLPKMQELATRMHVALASFHDSVHGNQPRPRSRPESTETPSDVLSSPYPGMEPRYVAQHDGHPDPIQKTDPTPPSQVVGKTDPEGQSGGGTGAEEGRNPQQDRARQEGALHQRERPDQARQAESAKRDNAKK